MSTHYDKADELVSFRLSPQQELLRALGGQMVSQVAAVLRGATDAGALEAALVRAVERHEILRTTIVTPAGVRARQQVIHERLAPAWTTRDGGRELLDDADALTDVLADEARAGLDVERGPLVRGLLLTSGDRDGVLVITACAEAADAASLLRLVEELTERDERDEPAEPIQYADYAEWRHQFIAEADEATQDGGSPWRSADWPPAPRILFGTSGPHSFQATARVPIRLDADALELLVRAADASGVSVSTFLEAAWHALIGRLTGTDELMLARTLDGRAQEDLYSAVGPYAQPVPIRSHADASTSFAEIIDQVDRSGADGVRGQDYASAAQLAELIRAAPAGFAHLDTRAAPSVEIAAVTPPLAAHPVVLHCVGRDLGLRVELRYDPAAFDAADVGTLAACLTTLLAGAARDPAAPVARLELIDGAERSRLLSGATPTRAPTDDATTLVHHRFEDQARLTPDRLAVTGSAGVLRYGELNEHANRLAHHLRELGVAPGVAVGLCMERTPSMLTALLAILKAGGAYVPLNLEHPPARIADQLARAQASVLVTHEHLLERLGSLAATVVCPERDAAVIAERPAGDPVRVAGPQDLVYVMYTSGSTGLPKGVRVTHANLANYTAYMTERLAVAEPAAAAGLQFAVVSAISTDLGNTAIFPALAGGGCVHLIDPPAAMDGDAYATYASANPIDVLKITPSHLRALLAGSRAAAVLPRRWLVLGGEALSWELVARIRALRPSCRLINHYGPTETTVGCCTYDVGDGAPRADAATVPIGTPIAGAWAYVLDGELEPVPLGVPGELYIGGAGVAAGYAGDPAESAQRFVPDPDGRAGRAYRTGDRARYLRDGVLEFLGRVDDQVKVRGYRVEPGEIEAVLVRHPQVRQAAVAIDDSAGEPRLVAYLVAAQEPSVEELQAFLATSLPDYMVPSAFATLEALPFTASGKIDRRSLAGLAAVRTRRETEFVAPRDAVEEEIAAIWRDLLGVEQVGVFDDFFALGGHSLLATQAIIRIRRVHGDIPLRALLAAPTVAAIADVVRATGEGGR